MRPIVYTAGHFSSTGPFHFRGQAIFILKLVISRQRAIFAHVLYWGVHIELTHAALYRIWNKPIQKRPTLMQMEIDDSNLRQNKKTDKMNYHCFNFFLQNNTVFCNRFKIAFNWLQSLSLSRCQLSSNWIKEYRKTSFLTHLAQMNGRQTEIIRMKTTANRSLSHCDKGGSHLPVIKIKSILVILKVLVKWIVVKPTRGKVKH